MINYGITEYNNISFAEIFHINETTIEGMMFWEILFISYSIYRVYASHFDCNTLRLSDKGVKLLFEKMTNYLQRYGKD